LHKNGIFLGENAPKTVELRLSPQFPLPKPEIAGKWRFSPEKPVEVESQSQNLQIKVFFKTMFQNGFI